MTDKEDVMEMLKPCPFCGGSARAEKDPNYHGSSGECWSIHCVECGIFRGDLYGYKPTAIAAWNRRPDSGERAVIEAAKELALTAREGDDLYPWSSARGSVAFALASWERLKNALAALTEQESGV